MRRNLQNLFRLNARKGEFKAEANTIWLYDVIVSDDLEAEWVGGIAPKPFINALKTMTGTVHIRINSPGGDVFGATAMAQAMREYPGEIICHVDGVAASAASVIAISGSKTVMAPGSLLMIHNAWTMAVGDRHELLDTASLLEKVDGMLAEGYAAKTGGDVGSFRTMMDEETWFTPAEAMSAKLADAIADKSSAPSASWDLSVFAKAPQAALTRTTTVTETTEITVETTVEVQTVEVVSGEKSAMTPEDSTANEIEARKRHHAAAMLRKTA